MAKKKNGVFSTISEKMDQNNEISTLSATNNIEIYSNTNDVDQIINNLKSEISKLNIQNSELTEKLVVYLENKDTTTQYNTVSAELEKLRYEKSELQNENDSYLMKISELSFENAKLTSQLQQLQALSKDNPNVLEPTICKNSKQKTTTINSNFVSYNSCKKDGYSSWN